MLTSFVNESHEKHNLHDGWKVRLVNGDAPPMFQSKLLEGIKAEVPGSIYLDLLRLDLIPDPFFAENEKKSNGFRNATGSIPWSFNWTKNGLRVERMTGYRLSSKVWTRLRKYTSMEIRWRLLRTCFILTGSIFQDP